MFAEKLTDKDVKKYLIEYTKCNFDVEVYFINGRTWRVMNYVEPNSSKKKIRNINLTDFNFDYIYNKKWCLYLYKLFGKEYLNEYNRLAPVYNMPNLKD